jgi:hypothetical protein
LNHSLSVSYQNNINAGTANASASYPGDANHTASSASNTFTIAKAGVIVNVTGGVFTYDGQAHGATSSSVTGPGGLSTAATIAYYSGATLLPGAPTDAGSYTVVASYAGDANHNPGTASAPLVIQPKDLLATDSTKDPINIAKVGTITFALSNVTGIVAGDGTLYDLFNGATFVLKVNGTPYSISSTATVVKGTVYVTWHKTQELYQDLYAALNGASPSARTLVDFFVSGVSKDGNYTLTEDVFARIFQQGKVIFT